MQNHSILKKVYADSKYLEIHRGEVWVADLGDEAKGSEQAGIRPVLILQNDIGNKHSPTTIVACITSKNKPKIPTHAYCHLLKNSTILLEQVRTISKTRLLYRINSLSPEKMREVDEKLKISLGLIQE